MKKIFILFLTLAIIIMIYWWFGRQRPSDATKESILPDNKLKTFTPSATVSPQTIKTKQSKVPLTPVPTAAAKDTGESINRPNYPKRNGRIIIGLNAHKFLNLKRPLIVQNKYNSNWDKFLLKYFEGVLPEYKITIEPEVSLILLDKKGFGRYVEQVTITINGESDASSSYRAMIDAENGKMLYTWDQTHHEHDPRNNWSVEIDPDQLFNNY